MDGGLGVAQPQPAGRCGDTTENLICGDGVLMTAPFSRMSGGIGQLQIKRSTGEQRQSQGRMAVGGQAIRHAAHPDTQTKHLEQHSIDTNKKRFRINMVRICQLWRAQAARWHNAIGELNQAALEEAGHCHRPTGRTSNCHEAFRSVWWPHSDLSHRRAIPYPTGKRHSGVDAAANQICLPSQRGIPGPSLAQHPAASDANGITPQHNQQGLQTMENDGVVEAMAGSGIYVRDQQKPREIKTPPHIRNRRHGSRQGSTQMCRWTAERGCTLQQTRELLTRKIDWRLRRLRSGEYTAGRHRCLHADRRRTEPCLMYQLKSCQWRSWKVCWKTQATERL